MFDPKNWYWRAADGRIFSSSLQAIVDEDDEAFVAWQNDDRKATFWPVDHAGEQTDDALQDVLSPHGLYVSIEAMKVGLKNAIDRAAESERLKYITAGAGQAMTYQQKADEAARYLAAEDPDEADYPMLAAEVGITANDMHGVAVVVDAAFRQWQIIGAAIERVRRGTNVAIDAAATASDAQAAATAASWPDP